MHHCLLTVPHSATTFVRSAFQHKMDSDELKYGHFELSYGHMTNLQHRILFAVLRDPLATFCTHARRLWTTRNISKERLREIYITQQMYVERYSLQVFPIEFTTLQEIGDWLGATPLHTHDTNSFGPNDLKTAIDNRDAAELKKLLGASDWQYFTEVMTPTISDFYTKHGYDLWWNK